MTIYKERTKDHSGEMNYEDFEYIVLDQELFSKELYQNFLEINNLVT